MRMRLLLLAVGLSVTTPTIGQAHCGGSGGGLHPLGLFSFTFVGYGPSGYPASVPAACGHQFVFVAETVGAGRWVLRNGATDVVWMQGDAPHAGTTPVVPFDHFVLEVWRTTGIPSTPVSAFLEAYR